VVLAVRMAVLGCGRVGRTLVYMASSTGRFEEVLAVDVDPRALSSVEGFEGVKPVNVDVLSGELVKVLKGLDVVCEALPGRLGFKALRSCIEAGVDVASASYMPEDPTQLDPPAREASVTIVPDCGVAPGISNLLAGRAYALMDELLELSIKVGGLPSNPNVPLKHVASWSLEDLVEEYTRRPKLIREGKVVEVEPLSGYEVLRVPGLGLFECFYTDGLRTMLKTIRARGMYEKTIRHRGHVEALRALTSLGLLSSERLDGIEMRSLLVKLLSRAWQGLEEDLLVLLVDALGIKEGRRARLSFKLIAQGSPPPSITATAAMCLSVASMLAEGLVKGPGVVTPEELGMDERVYEELQARLKGAGFTVEEYWGGQGGLS